MPSQIQSCVKAFCLSSLVVILSGCGTTRVVYVTAGDPVRLADPVKARVWVKDSAGNVVRSNNKVTIPEGWYALPK